MKKENLAKKAAKVKNELEKFIKDNSFTNGELSLQLNYNHYHETNKNPAYDFVLKKGNDYNMRLTFSELKQLRDFINKLNLIEE